MVLAGVSEGGLKRGSIMIRCKEATAKDRFEYKILLLEIKF